MTKKTRPKYNNRSVHPLYNIWSLMKSRCLNPKSKHYKEYGAKGVKMFEGWINSFATFCKDVGDKPGENYVLNRYPDNTGNFEPGNVKWVKWVKYASNKINSHYVDYKGKRYIISSLARTVGISPQLLRKRLFVENMLIEDALQLINYKTGQKLKKIEDVRKYKDKDEPHNIPSNPIAYL